jgi:hypothetical protein
MFDVLGSNTQASAIRPIFRHWSQVYEYHQDAVQGQIFIFFKGVEKFLVRCKRRH